MKNRLLIICILMYGVATAELPIPRTTFRKAPLETVVAQAEAEHPDAQLELALRYYAGHQVEVDLDRAFQWMHLSADQNHPDALYLLSRMYAEGIGVEASVEKERLWFARALAADPEDRALQEQYGQMLDRSEDQQAFLRMCAEAGYQPAAFQAELPTAMEAYTNGQYEDALPLFIALAEDGSAESAYFAGRIYADGKGLLDVNPVEAFVWFKQAAEGGCAPAQYELALRYEKGLGVEPDARQALSWMQKAAEEGNADAQFKMGELQFQQAVSSEHIAGIDAGSSEEHKDYREALSQAVRWYQAAATQNHAEALFVMGRLTASGEGVMQDPEAAVGYYEQALARGQAEAGFYLGLMCHAGLGVPKNSSRAMELYQRAADCGVTGALYYLAGCCRSGDGMPKNLIKGEGIYYEKLLKDRAFDRSDVDEWVLKAAREYGVIRWNSAERQDALSKALRWIRIASQGGDPSVREALAAMSKTIRRDQGLSESRMLFSENRPDPAGDAVKKIRPVIFFPYVYQEAEDAPTGALVLSAVKGLGSQQGVRGEDVQGLTVKFSRPARSQALGYAGMILLGIEFQDRNTDERYWSFVEYFDQQPLLDSTSRCSMTASCRLPASSRLKITGWAVVYGNSVSDGRTIDVFSENESKTEGLEELFRRNAYSKAVEASLNVYLEATDDSNLLDESGDGILSTIIGTVL